MSRSHRRQIIAYGLSMFLMLTIAPSASLSAEGKRPDVETLVGQPVDIASSAYQYRADRAADQNPPESWLAPMRCAKQPLNKPVNMNAPEMKNVLCSLIWEEVRRVRRVVLVWNGAPERRPKPEDVVLTFFDAEAPNNIPTWWNPTVLREAGKAEVSSDGTAYTFAIPVDIFGLVVGVRGGQSASAYEVPVVRAFTPDVWKKMDLEIEWGFDKLTAALDYSGRVEAYDGVVDRVKPLPNDAGTALKGHDHWQSAPISDGRRGVRLSLLYQGTSKYRKVWPYNGEPDDIARTIVTVWTNSGNFSFLASDLEKGPILAPEYGFFVRSLHISTPAPQSTSDSSPPFQLGSKAASAREFIAELASKNLTTIRQRTRRHSEQTWEGAVGAMFPGKTLPAIPKPEFEPSMKVDVPCEKLTAQWKLARGTSCGDRSRMRTGNGISTTTPTAFWRARPTRSSMRSTCKACTRRRPTVWTSGLVCRCKRRSSRERVATIPRLCPIAP